MEFPRYAYKPGAMFEWDGEWFDYILINDQDEYDIAAADGWIDGKPTPDQETAIEAAEPTRTVRKRDDA